jgi:hypothetical protein
VVLDSSAHDEKTHLVFRAFERSVDIIISSPDPRNTGLVVAESFFEVRPQLAKDADICSLFVNLCTEYLPRPAA